MGYCGTRAPHPALRGHLPPKGEGKELPPNLPFRRPQRFPQRAVQHQHDGKIADAVHGVVA